MARVHDAELRLTEPVPLWEMETDPVGEYPVTVILQVIVFEDPATTVDGEHEIVVPDVCLTTDTTVVPLEGAYVPLPS